MTSEAGDGPGVRVLGASDGDLPEGYKVGEYIVDCRIGEGGFGTVFKATHPLIGKLVAVKVLNRQFSAQEDMVSRFVAEARAVNQIRHRNIIDIFAFGQLEDGRHYYIMEMLEGMPLDEFLDERERLAIGEAIPILRSVARALDAAHAKGIAHRDLKPENVFLVPEDDGGLFPKLLDFGIAKLLRGDNPTAHKTRTGAPMGTPHYMSPEQCRGREVDHRTDIYAFGIMTYRMLCGVLPFDGEDYMDILLAQLQEEAAPPSSHAPELPPSVDDGIAWMLKKEPAERPPNLVTAVRALEEAAVSAGMAVPVRPAPSGIYAASTSSVSAQATPAHVAPMSSRTPLTGVNTPLTGAGSASGVGLAQTMGADSLSSEMAAVGDMSVGTTGPSKGMLLGGAVVGAVAVGALMFFLLGGKSTDTTDTTDTTDSEALAASVAPQQVAYDALPNRDVNSSLARATVVTADAGITALPDKKPALVNVLLEGAPEGAEVFVAGRLVGVAPEIQLERGDNALLLTIRAEGFRATTRKVRPVADKTIKVAMKRKRRSGRGHTRSGRDGKNGRNGKNGRDGKDKRNTLEDPFKK